MLRIKAVAALGFGSFAFSNSGWAQDASGGGLGLTVVPRVSVTQTWTDNLAAQAGVKDAALITLIAPGVNVSSRAGRIRGALDYALNGSLYIKSDRKNSTQHALSGTAVAELIDRTLFVDTQASITQQTASAFGRQTVDNSLANANRNEVATLTVSPYLRGSLAGLASLELRANSSESNTKDSTLGDSRTSGGSLRIDGLVRGAVNWFGTATTQSTTYKASTSYRSATVNAGLRYRPDPELLLGMTLGQERNDLAGNGSRTTASYGLSGTWTLSPRTSLAGDWQHHDYGDSHSLSFSHRMARSAWRFSDSQSASLGNGQGNGVGTGAAGQRSNYDLLFLQFASLEPDPVKRDALVRSTLQTLGLSPDAFSTSGFISASPTLQRRQDLSFSLQGLRTTVTALLSRSRNRQLGAATKVNDDFAQSSTITQRSASISLSHRLTPDSTVNVSLSDQQTRGDLAAQSTSLKSAIASWGGQLGRRGSVSLGARHSRFEGVTPYSENAVFATVVQQF
jgi:uncharacterized protein (PEP-CTERM system associated)